MAFEKFPYSNFHDLNLDWIIQQVNEWAEQWAEVKQAYEEFDADLTEIFDDIEELQSLTSQNTQRINNLEASAGNLNNAVLALSEHVDAVAAIVDSNYTELNNRVSAIETSATFYMYSPFTGQYEPLENVITELASFHLQDALTASEYDALQMTAQAYDTKQLTAIQYDSSGRTLLP